MRLPGHGGSRGSASGHGLEYRHRLQGSKPGSCEGPCRAAVLVSGPAAALQYESIAAEIPSVMENMPCPSDTHLLHTKGP